MPRCLDEYTDTGKGSLKLLLAAKQVNTLNYLDYNVSNKFKA